MTQPPFVIQLPELALVVLIGASSAGKSSFAARHFEKSEVLSSDFFRYMVSGDENSLAATQDAFDSLFFVAQKRLRRGLLTVIDATSVKPASRAALVKLAREQNVLPVAIVLDLPPSLLQERHAARTDRAFDPRIVAQQSQQLRRAAGGLAKEGFVQVWTLRREEEVNAAQVVRQPLSSNRSDLRGPFDFIGDVHGCLTELRELLTALGYTGDLPQHPAGRQAVFVGDLTDRGPDSAGVLRLVMDMVRVGAALMVPGNHDDKLRRALLGHQVSGKHGLAGTLEQLEAWGQPFKDEVLQFIARLPSHLRLDGGAVVVAHAGLPEHLQGRSLGRVRHFALFGDVDGSLDEAGLPLRRDWAADYHGAARVIYGHTPVARPQWVNRTINIDTGCAFGGALTALRYPELELVGVPAQRQYAEPSRPFLAADTGAAALTQPLDWQDLSADIRLSTPTGPVRLRPAERLSALETYARYGIDPRGCLYLPPTMSPVESGRRPDALEYPTEAFEYYRQQGLTEVICEEKHMGSRALLLLTRSPEVAQQQFGRSDGAAGYIYTRTGRAFFTPDWERQILQRAQLAAEEAGLWAELDTNWLLLDAEILPWSLKAHELIREQYAAVAVAGRAALSAEEALLATCTHLPELAARQQHAQARLQALNQYQRVYRAYTQQVDGPQDIHIKPFHLLASRGKVHSDQSHLWHLQTLARLTEADPKLFGNTAYQLVQLTNAASEASAVNWWENLTQFDEAGKLGEGMVVKPLEFLPGPRIQPALKVRGREYLRLIYGPEYLLPEHLERLRQRAIKTKRTRALREFGLGLEALRRVTEGEDLPRIHECVLGVLALESEAIDARL